MIISQRRASDRRARAIDLQFRSILAPGYMLACLLLGGASNGGALANGLLQIAAIALIAWSILDPRAAPLSPPARTLVAFGGLSVALVLLQLVPLPPGLWSLLPGHDVIAEGYRLMGMKLPWLPISLTPAATVASAIAMLPAIAMALLVLRMPAPGMDALRLLFPGVAALSVLVGLAQLVGGQESPLYFYERSNRGLPIGFFANVNHQATLLLAAIPFLLALEARGRNGRNMRSTDLGRRLLIGGIGVLLLVGIVMTGSVAGYLMIVPVALAGWLLIGRKPSGRASAVLALVLVAMTAGVMLLATLSPVVPGADTTFEGPMSRPDIYAVLLRAAPDYLPFGSGIGSFPAVFPMFEDPAQVTRIYANHAHGDYLELALETGVPGLLLLGAFLIWWARRVIFVWRGGGENPFLQRAAAIASAVILVHSLIDYPVRTAAIMALFAACLAILAEPMRATREKRAATSAPTSRHISAD